MAAGRIVLSQYFPARDRNARLVSGALLYVYTNGTTTKASIYSNEALTTALANPVAANSSGQFPAIWASDAVTYTLSITDADGASIGNPSVFDNYSVSTDADTASVALAEAAATAADVDADAVAAAYADILAVVATGSDAAAIAARAAKAANLSDLADAEAATGNLLFRAGTVGAVTRPVDEKLADGPDLRDSGVTADGTDQTADMVTLFGTLSGDRRLFHIGEGTDFDLDSVYAAVPVGTMLWDKSFVNWSNGGYKQRRLTFYSSDSVSDDGALMIASNHNPALILNNFRTGGTVSADDGVISAMITAYGKSRNNGSEMINWQTRYDYDPVVGAGCIKYILYTPIQMCFGNPDDWATATVYAAESYCISDSGKVYQTTLGGTSGVTAPTGTGTAINDGGVLWDYVQAALTLQATRFRFDENGNLSQFGSGALSHKINTAGSDGITWTVAADGGITERDDGQGLSPRLINPSVGQQFGMALSLSPVTLSGATASAPSTGYGQVTNASPTSMSTITRISGRTKMLMFLRFTNANTTVVHSASGTDTIRLATGANAVMPANSWMLLWMDTVQSGSWEEVSRSSHANTVRTALTTPVTVATNDKILLVNLTTPGAVAVNLPATWPTGEVLTIKDAKGDAASNNITINRSGAQTIDGATTLVISANYGAVRLAYGGTNWSVV